MKKQYQTIAVKNLHIYKSNTNNNVMLRPVYTIKVFHQKLGSKFSLTKFF